MNIGFLFIFFPGWKSNKLLTMTKTHYYSSFFVDNWFMITAVCKYRNKIYWYTCLNKTNSLASKPQLVMIRITKPQEIAESSVTHASCPQSQHTTKICLDFIFQDATATLRKDRKFLTVDWLSFRVPHVLLTMHTRTERLTEFNSLPWMTCDLLKLLLWL